MIGDIVVTKYIFLFLKKEKKSCYSLNDQNVKKIQQIIHKLPGNNREIRKIFDFFLNLVLSKKKTICFETQKTKQNQIDLKIQFFFSKPKQLKLK